MRAILLNGSQENNSTGDLTRSVLTQELKTRGWEVEHILLREQKIGNCAGDFFCWVRNPGICNVNDDNRTIAEAIMKSDLLVYLTPITFGGYSSTLKRMVDHQIQNLSPYFSKIEGETHHQKRYARYPDFLAIGWMQEADPQSEAIFRQLCRRNAINMFAEKAVSGMVIANQPASQVLTVVQGCLDGLQSEQKRQSAKLPVDTFRAAVEMEFPGRAASSIRRALLLVGSPRTRKSSSQALGGYLFDQLRAQSIQTETIYLHTILRSPEKMNAMLKALDSADLVLLAFPLYVDSLPAPVIEALEKIAAHKQASESIRPTFFAALANCGFPEAAHNATALAICKEFARQAGFTWAGSLALGAGEGLVHGADLKEASGPAIPIKKSLEMAAAALARGEGIPQAAQTLLAKPIIPGWLYRIIGGFGWNQLAKKYGVLKLMKRKTYQLMD
jgi:NAD(P)H-dependent FMN reductase